MAGTTGGVTVKVDGVKQLRRTIKKAGGDLDDFAEANAEAGRIVVAESQSWVAHRSGGLAGSIRAGAAKTNATVRAGGAGIKYAGVQEFGWPSRNRPPHPYLTTAAKSSEPRWTDAYFARLEAIVAKITGA